MEVDYVGITDKKFNEEVDSNSMELVTWCLQYIFDMIFLTQLWKLIIQG